MGRIIDIPSIHNGGGSYLSEQDTIPVTFRFCGKETVVPAALRTPFQDVVKTGAGNLQIYDDVLVFSKGKLFIIKDKSTADAIRDCQTSCFGISPRGLVAMDSKG